jgi:hypothetical protein
MKFACAFVHPKTRERRSIVITLDNDEVADLKAWFAARSDQDQAALIAAACALRRAYRDMPRGFVHERVERMAVH